MSAAIIITQSQKRGDCLGTANGLPAQPQEHLERERKSPQRGCSSEAGAWGPAGEPRGDSMRGPCHIQKSVVSLRRAKAGSSPRRDTPPPDPVQATPETELPHLEPRWKAWGKIPQQPVLKQGSKGPGKGCGQWRGGGAAQRDGGSGEGKQGVGTLQGETGSGVGAKVRKSSSLLGTTSWRGMGALWGPWQEPAATCQAARRKWNVPFRGMVHLCPSTRPLRSLCGFTGSSVPDSKLRCGQPGEQVLKPQPRSPCPSTPPSAAPT